MKTAIPFLVPILLLPSCAIRGANEKLADGTTRSWHDITIGTDTKNSSTGFDKTTQGEQNQSKTAMSAIRTGGTAISVWAAASSAATQSDNAAKVDLANSNNAAAGVAAKEATKQTAIKADAATEALKIAKP